MAALAALPGFLAAGQQACENYRHQQARFELLDNYREYIIDVEAWKEKHCDVEEDPEGSGGPD